jgi:hypothetical protein
VRGFAEFVVIGKLIVLIVKLENVAPTKAEFTLFEKLKDASMGKCNVPFIAFFFFFLFVI